MGALSDLGTGIVHDICPETGYPRTHYRRLLNTVDPRDGALTPGWAMPGTELYNFTSPYGHLEFAVGSGDDFWCFDYAKVNAGPRGKFVVLHATINSETGSFIMDASYELLPINTTAEEKAAVAVAFDMVGRALIWCGDNALRHSVRGWNQQPYYFAIAVAHNFRPWAFKMKNGKSLPIRKGYNRAYKIAWDFAHNKEK